jgi:hypothetical protein
MTRTPAADVVMERLLRGAAREFPGWAFERDQHGWTAARGEIRLTRPTLAALRALLCLHRAAR